MGAGEAALPFLFPFKLILRPATHYQVDLTGTSDHVRLSGLPDSVCAHQVYLTGGPDRVYLSGLPDSEWLA
jgi:hypothetical protein